VTTSALPKLLARHRQSGVAIDSNLLLLLWIGSFDRSLIQRFKRTQKYTEADFDLLVRLVSRVRVLVTTPNVLTEVSNLAGQLPEQMAEEFRVEMQRVVQQINEQHFPCKLAAAEDCFISLGLTDSTLTMLARGKILVLTDDLPLYARLHSEKMPVINFTHVRSMAYGWEA
jgi:rRNA-processing protein FCF1